MEAEMPRRRNLASNYHGDRTICSVLKSFNLYSLMPVSFAVNQLIVMINSIQFSHPLASFWSRFLQQGDKIPYTHH